MQNFPIVRIALDFSRSFLSLCGLFRFVSVCFGGGWRASLADAGAGEDGGEEGLGGDGAG